MQDGSHVPDDSARRTHVRALLEAARCQAATLPPRSDYVPVNAFENPNALPGYTITEIIHRGGQGVVYQARQHSNGRTVAVKIMREGPHGGPRDFARFEREVQILGQLVHPNIVRILDSGTASGNAYFVMDHILGVPLDHWLQDEHLPSEPGASTDSALRLEGRESESFVTQTLQLFVKICDAVHAAHLRGIIHRDLKPSNILIDGNGEPHILDFGLAKLDASGLEGSVAAGVTTTGHFVGSLPWASPEQAAGDSTRIDIRTDVYAIGVMLYHALVGRFPYSVACGVRDALDRIMNSEPARPSSTARDLNDELDTIILKCLAKVPERRYETAGELARDLRHYLANEPIEAKRDSTWYVLRKAIHRHRAIITTLLAFFLLILGSSVVAFSLMLQARRSEETAQSNLRDSLLAQARARRQVLTTGRRSESLHTLSKAAKIRPGIDLRNEAIATLAVPDLIRQPVFAPPGARAVCFSRDLTLSAFSLPDGGVIIEGTDDGVEMARIPPPAVPSVGIGKWYCSSGLFVRSLRLQDQTQQLEVWHVPDVTLSLTITDVPRNDEYDVASDGRTLAVGRGDRAIHIYDLASGLETRRIPVDRNAGHLRFDPSGKKLLSCHDGQASIMDLEQGTWSRVFDEYEISNAVAWSPDGRLLAGAQEDLIHLWDALENKPIAVLRGDSGVVQLAFSNDSRLLASYGWEGASVFWSMATLRPILRSDLSSLIFAPNTSAVGGLTFLDGVSNAFRGHLLYQDIYRIVSDDPGTTKLKAFSGAVHPSGRIAVATFVDRTKNIGGLAWFDLPRQSVIGKLECGAVDKVQFDPAGSVLYTTGSQGLLKWPVVITETVLHLGPPRQLLRETPAEQFDLSATGHRLAIASPSGRSTLTVLDTEHLEEKIAYQCLPKGFNVAVSPDGKWAVVTTWHGSGGEVWDLDSGTVVARLELTSGAFPKFSPDGRWLTIREWSYLKFLHPGTWNEARCLNIGLGSRVGFSPNGRIAAVGDNRNVIHLIDTDTFDELALLEPPDLMAIADAPCFINDSTLAVFAAPGAILQLWDLRRIRSTLASMGLDWDHPPISSSSTDPALKPLTLEANTSAFGQ